jgi:antitoxin ParD1/3/4/toxin ParE1/3/4
MTGYVLSVDADLFDAFESLARTPGIGHKREDLTAYPVLFWPVGSYLIIYRAEHRPIEIVAVTQGSRDVPTFLRRRLH